MNVTSSKTIVLTQDLSTGNILTINNVPFQPDVCILKSVSYTDSDTSNNSDVFYITSSLTTGYIYSFTPHFNLYNTSFNLSVCTSPNIHLVIKNILSQQVTFTIGGYSGTPVNGLVSLVVEFIKYK